MKFKLEPQAGYDPKIGELVTFMETMRGMTLADLEGITQEELDRRPPGGNAIGALLEHLAAIEYVHQIITFEERDPKPEDLNDWQTGLMLGDAQEKLRGKSLQDYLQQLEDMRSVTFRELQRKRDSWLYTEGEWEVGIPFNYYYLWMHVVEDEISHRGQIRMMRRELAQR
ncbi:DinB family protein [Bacillus daqingensis]|uniref:DinB family protein n=1 Tax=Bacillus daqingensis TaxID=872396 RepID=A0ABV9NVL4_9BACI